MPYITQERREALAVDEFPEWPRTAGELNYEITMLILAYLRQNGGDYQRINDVLGALEGAKLEFYRRIVGPYERLKMQQNGDVY